MHREEEKDSKMPFVKKKLEIVPERDESGKFTMDSGYEMARGAFEGGSVH